MVINLILLKIWKKTNQITQLIKKNKRINWNQKNQKDNRIKN